MCGRFTLTAQDYAQLCQLLKAEYDQELATQYRPRFNIAPSDFHWILGEEDQARQLRPARWGLIPHWAKDQQGLINARVETVYEKPSFRSSFLSRRCGIPADGFYEWIGEKKAKRPIWFHRKDQGVFLFAGLYRDYTDKITGETVRTFTILTTEANAEVRPYHARMPVILRRELLEPWLTLPPPKEKEDMAKLRGLLTSQPQTPLVATPVSRRVNSPRNDDPECINPEE